MLKGGICGTQLVVKSVTFGSFQQKLVSNPGKDGLLKLVLLVVILFSINHPPHEYRSKHVTGTKRHCIILILLKLRLDDFFFTFENDCQPIWAYFVFRQYEIAVVFYRVLCLLFIIFVVVLLNFCAILRLFDFTDVSLF